MADSPGLRPTPDRVRETLFNWLGQDLTGWHCADLFAGTGALGFEAASRGAAEVWLVEQAPELARMLEANAKRLDARQVRVHRGDALQWARQGQAERFDLVFIDPPFANDWFDRALQGASRLVKPEGWAYLEADRPFDAETLALAGWRLHRDGRAGMVHYHLLQRLPTQA